MKKLILLFFCCIPALLFARSVKFIGEDPANTYVFMTGVLKWKSSSLNSFSDRNRKDEEFYRLLLRRGVKKENIIFLKDNEATLANMNRGLETILKKADKQSMFIFYYAGHGVRAGNGPVSFANYDYENGNGFEVTTVSKLVSSFFKGTQIYLLADCCFSGSLMDEAKKISTSGKQTIAFTSSSSSNISTANWTFTQTMIDCFEGLPVCDRNTDGKITLGEVKKELFDAMKYREKQLSGTVFYNSGEAVTFSVITSPVKPGMGMKAVEYRYIQQNGKFEAARVTANTGTTITGELYRYSDKLSVTVPLAKTKPIAFAEYPVKMIVQVEWKGRYYPAEIKETREGFHYIHYTGYDDSWNEWVMYDRINTGDRKKCTVMWEGKWYPGELLQQKDGKYFIHYTGFGNDWDEWVEKERIKF